MEQKVVDVLLKATKARLFRLRLARLGLQGMTFSFALGFAYVFIGEPQMSVGLAMMLLGLAVGFFASFTLLKRIAVEIVNDKLTIKLLETGLIHYINKIIDKIVE